MQALPAMPESLCIVEMGGVEGETEGSSLGGLFLSIGLSVRILGTFRFDNEDENEDEVGEHALL